MGQPMEADRVVDDLGRISVVCATHRSPRDDPRWALVTHFLSLESNGKATQ